MMNMIPPTQDVCTFCNGKGYTERGGRPDAEKYLTAVCRICEGTGILPTIEAMKFAADLLKSELLDGEKPSKEVTCDTCGGMKEVWHDEYCPNTGRKTSEQLELCAKCAGTGKLMKGKYDEVN